MIKVICDHADEQLCAGCQHCEPHTPIPVNDWPEYCNKKGGVCMTPRCEVICIKAKSPKKTTSKLPIKERTMMSLLMGAARLQHEHNELKKTLK